MSHIDNKTERCMYRQWFYDYKAFGKALKLARVEKDLTQEAVALAVGCSRSTYWKMERGGYCNPQTMANVCQYLGVDLMRFNVPPTLL